MTMTATDDLVVLPVQRRAEPYEPRERAARAPRRARLTLTDRLVATSGVDRVVVDVAALERDLAALRT